MKLFFQSEGKKTSWPFGGGFHLALKHFSVFFQSVDVIKKCRSLHPALMYLNVWCVCLFLAFFFPSFLPSFLPYLPFSFSFASWPSVGGCPHMTLVFLTVSSCLNWVFSLPVVLVLWSEPGFLEIAFIHARDTITLSQLPCGILQVCSLGTVSKYRHFSDFSWIYVKRTGVLSHSALLMFLGDKHERTWVSYFIISFH